MAATTAASRLWVCVAGVVLVICLPSCDCRGERPAWDEMSVEQNLAYTYLEALEANDPEALLALLAKPEDLEKAFASYDAWKDDEKERVRAEIDQLDFGAAPDTLKKDFDYVVSQIDEDSVRFHIVIDLFPARELLFLIGVYHMTISASDGDSSFLLGWASITSSKPTRASASCPPASCSSPAGNGRLFRYPPPPPRACPF